MIELLVASPCDLLKEVHQELQVALHELGINEKIIIREVRNYPEARKIAFIGSPTIRIDGKDIDPENTTFYSEKACRTYFFAGKTFKFPPKEMIKDAIIRIRGKTT